MSKKTYGYNEQDTTKLAQWWEQESVEGHILFVVFYTTACRYEKCTGCPLPQMSTKEPVNFKELMSQVDYLMQYAGIDMRQYNKIIVSNNGSMFDEKTFSTTALIYLISQLNIYAPQLEKVTMESRIEYIEECELEVLSRALKEGDKETKLEIAIGFEAWDDTIRNKIFKKGISTQSLYTLAGMVHRHNMDLKIYFMLKPVPMETEAAIKDIHEAIISCEFIANTHEINVNLHLNPTWVAKGTQLEKDFNEGKYTPPTIKDIANAVIEGKNTSDRFSIYIGIDDEGLAVEGGSYNEMLESKDAKHNLYMFNITQDYKYITEILEFE